MGLWEETGIVSDSLTQLCTMVDEEDSTIYAAFLCVTDRDKGHITLQPGETVAFKWVTAEDPRAMSPGELVTHRILSFIEELR